MAIQKQSYKIRGMRKDSLIGSGYASQFAYDIKNLRLNTLGDSTTLVWTNEEGTKEETIKWGVINSNGNEIGIKWSNVKFEYKWYELKYYNSPLDMHGCMIDGKWYKHTEQIWHTDYVTFDFDDCKPIGQGVVNDQWVVFCHASKEISVLKYTPDDYIVDTLTGQKKLIPTYENKTYNCDTIIKFFYDKKNNKKFTGLLLFFGDLNFDYEHPIETMPYYENEYINKIYWIDGKNQPRLIDVGFEHTKEMNHKVYENHVNTRFDFVPEVQLEDKVFVTKQQTGGGLFPPGTVKYLFTYYYEYGQESNVVYETPLYYPTMGERACHPDELSGDVFQIDLYNIDIFHNYDYVRIYSVIRTTDNATPLVRNIFDVKIEDDMKNPDSPEYRHLRVIDSNTTGVVVDPSIVNYIGGHKIVPQTFDQKSNTLFFGNYNMGTEFPDVTKWMSELTSSLKFEKPINYKDFTGSHKRLTIRNLQKTGDVFYDYRNQLNFKSFSTISNPNLVHPMNRLEGNSQEIKYFKSGEKYLFGLQFQDKIGSWSSVVSIGTLDCEYKVDCVSWYQQSVYVPIATCKIPKEMREYLMEKGYEKVRMVCCLPSLVDRNVIAQGVINPTVYNTLMRTNHAPDVMASWFFRPNDVPDTIYTNKTFGNNYLPFQHTEPLCHACQMSGHAHGYNVDYLYGNLEIQSMFEGVQSNYHNNIAKDSLFYIDRTIFTLNSADFDFDERLMTLPMDKPIVNVVGFVPISGWASSIYVDADGPKTTLSGGKGNGFVKINVNKKWNKHDTYPARFCLEANLPSSLPDYQSWLYSYDRSNYLNHRCGSHTLSPGYWNDCNIYYDKDGGWYSDSNHPGGPGYPFYPFQRNTQLNNWVKDISDWEVTDYGSGSKSSVKITTTGDSKLHSKVLSHLLLSEKTYYWNDKNIDVQCFNIVNTKEVLPTKIDIEDNGNNYDYIYYGNMNTISPINTQNIEAVIDGYRSNSEEVNVVGSYPIYKRSNYGNMKLTSDDCWPSSDPVPLTYRSQIHAIFQSNDIKDEIDSAYITLQEKNELLCYDNIKDADEPFLWLVEVRRNVEDANKFGGMVEENIYIPCGPAYRLDGKDDTINTTTSSITQFNLGKELLKYKYTGSNYKRINTIDINGDLTIEGLEGDTYYMRYDCLKTVPFTMEDANQIVEILSFMCETRINLDGRYDTNRGLKDNTLVTDTNFNYINKSYTQSNNLFQYQELCTLSQVLDTFPNQITWTKTKQAGDQIDQWTNITLANIADADGTHGEITKISNFKDNLILFQEHGIAHIGYNEKTAITTQSGVPLEIANSEKFTGFQYLSHDVGVQNKWAVSNTRNGLMFIDDHRRQMHTLGGESTSTTEISTISDIDSFLISELPKEFVKWMPYDFTNFVTYFDNISKDIYWLNKDYCIAWNEVTKSFTSFYSYNHIPIMANVEKHFLMWKDNKIYAARENTDQYSWFFDKYEDYWMTLCCDGVMQEGNAFNIDKVFNNIEYRADLFDRISGLPREPINLDVFNKKAAWNGYQMYKEFDIDAIRKFNTWRVQLPRATYMDDDGNIFTNRDRIRGHYSFVKLLNDDAINSFENTTKGSRMILHDLAVYFDMK